MKKIIFTSCFCFFSLFILAQSSANLEKVVFKNNTFLPKKIVLIGYSPNDVGNSTSVFYLFPFVPKQFKFAAGTKLYIATSLQVDNVMGGNRIDSQTPTYVVSALANKQTITIF